MEKAATESSHSDGGHQTTTYDKAVDVSAIDETQVLSPQEIRRLTLKLDLRLMPIVWLVYFVNLLDRTAVGSAVAYGFRTDLGISGSTYNLGIALFYIFYAAMEVPSNLILKKIGAQKWLPIIGLLYGVCSLGTAFIRNGSQFLAVRVLLAIFEAGTLPGCAYFLSTYYGRNQLALRLPIFISASALASGVGALLATAYHGAGQIGSLPFLWSNIFFINAMITFVITILSYFLLPTKPETTSMLTEKERDYIMTRSKRLTAGREKEEASKWHLIGRAFTNPSVWFGVVPWFVAQVLASSLTFFLAQILREQFGYTANQANVRVAATFLVSFGLTNILGFFADRVGKHFPFVISIILVSLIGSTVFFYADNPKARYFGTFLGNIGIFGGTGINQAWVTSNCQPYTTRAVGTAISISVGSLGGIVGAYVFLPREAAQGYPTGAIVTLTLLSFAAVTTTLHFLWCTWENKQRALGKRDWRLNASPQEVELLGNLHPKFVLAT